MKKYSALIFDLDGTVIPLSDDGSSVTDSTRNAVTKATEQGALLACATGREWEIAKPVVQALGIQTNCIVEGGTRIIDPVTEKTVWQKEMPETAATVVHEIFLKHWPDGLLLHSDDLTRVRIADAEITVKQLRFMYLLNIPEKIAEVIVNDVNIHDLCIVAHMTPSWLDEDYYDVHVTHKDATKEQAIAQWLTLNAVSKSETMGMGDSGNDVPLFNGVGFRVAVGNATAPIKALADYVAPSVTEQSLEHVLLKFFIR